VADKIRWKILTIRPKKLPGINSKPGSLILKSSKNMHRKMLHMSANEIGIKGMGC